MISDTDQFWQLKQIKMLTTEAILSAVWSSQCTQIVHIKHCSIVLQHPH